jgi:hypothetical protein
MLEREKKIREVRELQKHRGEPGHTRDTRGTRGRTKGRASPRSFLTHHVANISTAIQTADAQTILNAASARMLRVSFGVM